MLQTRTIEEVQEAYIAGLAEAGTNLALDNKEGSLAYTLSRASAAIAIQQDNRMLELEQSSSLLYATGERLDTLGSVVSPREQALPSTGSVMALSKDANATLAANTILVQLSTGRQFITTDAVSILALYEVAVPVTSVETGAANNLVAGTPLYAPSYPTISFFVGSSHTDVYSGDLVGGRDLESDGTYRQRILQTIVDGPSSSESNLQRKLLTYPLVERAFVRTRVPGVVEIWVDASIIYTEAQREEILTYIRSYIAAGVLPSLIQAKRKAVGITVDVKPFASSMSDLSALSRNLTAVITSYIYDLDLGQTLLVAALKQVLAPLAKDITIVYPTSDVLCGINEIIVPGEIKFIFHSKYKNAS